MAGKRPYKHPQFNLRIPVDIKEKVTKQAENNGRSTNAEIIEMIKFCLDNKVLSNEFGEDDFARMTFVHNEEKYPIPEKYLNELKGEFKKVLQEALINFTLEKSKPYIEKLKQEAKAQKQKKKK